MFRAVGPNAQAQLICDPFAAMAGETDAIKQRLCALVPADLRQHRQPRRKSCIALEGCLLIHNEYVPPSRS
jgi:hypothetical protein